jgi:hypothetical protein
MYPEVDCVRMRIAMFCKYNIPFSVAITGERDSFQFIYIYLLL